MLAITYRLASDPTRKIKTEHGSKMKDEIFAVCQATHPESERCNHESNFEVTGFNWQNSFQSKKPGTLQIGMTICQILIHNPDASLS